VNVRVDINTNHVPFLSPVALAPYLLMRFINHLIECIEVLSVKATKKISCCRGIRDSPGSEHSTHRLAPLKVRYIFYAAAA
jgi:hypothetical protein